ncbi:hypothetical protein NM688_g3192 [Phlebia brevispora]|uniref:Uncharacterized protein n=1 Tax=Phlebia brevispora TaxID=194682 RepID=A0ACC1T6G4_9APHY|nr:hypothetical protein NM688_g3192 [Phlebia brevispora]
MSTQNSTEAIAQFIAENETQAAFNYVIFSLSALVAYEYAITFEREVELVWKPKWNGATLLFLLNRYLLFPYAILQWAMIMNASSSCHFYPLEQIIHSLASITSRRSMTNTKKLDILPWLRVTKTRSFHQEECSTVRRHALLAYCRNSPAFAVALGTRILLVIADVFVLAITWYKTRASLSPHLPLSTLLLRDGTLHFIAFLIMNIADVILLHYPELQEASFGSLFFTTLTGILLSRFLLNLRELRQPPEHSWTVPFAVSTAIGTFGVASHLTGNISELPDYCAVADASATEAGMAEIRSLASNP